MPAYSAQPAADPPCLPATRVNRTTILSILRQNAVCRHPNWKYACRCAKPRASLSRGVSCSFCRPAACRITHGYQSYWCSNFPPRIQLSCSAMAALVHTGNHYPLSVNYKVRQRHLQVTVNLQRVVICFSPFFLKNSSLHRLSSVLTTDI